MTSGPSLKGTDILPIKTRLLGLWLTTSIFHKTKFIKRVKELMKRFKKVLNLIIIPTDILIWLGLENLSNDILPDAFRNDILTLAEYPMSLMSQEYEILADAGFDGMIFDPRKIYRVDINSDEPFYLVPYAYLRGVPEHINKDIMKCARNYVNKSAYFTVCPPLKILNILKNDGIPILSMDGFGDLLIIKVNIFWDLEKITKALENGLSK